MRGSHVASLVEFHPVVKEEIAWCTDRRTDRHSNILSLGATSVLNFDGGLGANFLELGASNVF